MNPAGYASLGDATFIPLITVNKTLQISGSVTKTRGAHNLKIGAGLIVAPLPAVPERLGGRHVGVHDRADRQRRRRRAATASRRSCSDIRRRWRATHTLFDPHYRPTSRACYVQDDWRATSWLTLNLGVALRRVHAADRRGQPSLQHRSVDAEDARRRAERRVGDRRRQHRLFERRAAVRLRRDAAGRDGRCAAAGACRTSPATTCRSRC